MNELIIVAYTLTIAWAAAFIHSAHWWIRACGQYQADEKPQYEKFMALFTVHEYAKKLRHQQWAILAAASILTLTFLIYIL